MIRRAGQQLRELAERAWKWANENPLAFFVGLLFLVVFALILVQTVSQDNLGFADKSLWDWLDLFILSAVVAFGLFWLRQREGRRDEERRKQQEEQARLQQEQETARQVDNLRQEILNVYYDKMSELILDRDLKGKPAKKAGNGADSSQEETSDAVVIARARTLAVLRSLDPVRVSAVFRFLAESQLEEIVLLAGGDLRNVDWHEADLRMANLSKADLRKADLRAADLTGADLRLADLRGANIDQGTKLDHKWALVWKIVNEKIEDVDSIWFLLRGCDLREANLRGADLSRADLSWADLREADLRGAKLRRADLSKAKLGGADLRLADLGEANLSAVDLSKADLSKAKLGFAKLRRADLSGAELMWARLHKADLRRTILRHTNLGMAKLGRADLRGANLHGADLREADLERVRFDEETIWPDSFDVTSIGAQILGSEEEE